ncbi:CsgG/HfaB family protein [Fuchsiella alkaliacetigena]|nr:CsgG/HfaB family protein [Fuchsiella alkaliacetigena]
MLNYFLLFLLLCFLLASPVQAQDSVAVLEFEGAGGSDYHSAAANSLTNILMDLGRFDVISRSEVDRILEEQHFQVSGLVDEDTASEAGGILGVEQVFTGNIDKLTTSWSDGEYSGEAKVTIRLIDIETGTILQSFESTGSGSGDSRGEARSSALSSCFDSSLRSQLREVFAISSFVIRVDEEQVDLLGGSEMGISEGQRYYILRPEEYGDFTRKIGMVEIERVSGDRSRSEILWSSEEIKENDLIEEIPYSRRTATHVEASLSSYEFSNGEDKQSDLMPGLGLRIMREKVFDYEYGGVFSFARSEGINRLQLGGEGSYEFPLSRGRLHLLATAGAGGNIVSQSYSGYGINEDESGTAWGTGFYGSLGGGLKYYLDYDTGARLNLTLTGQLSSTISSWEDSDDTEVTNYVDYQEADFSGLGISFGASIPLAF